MNVLIIGSGAREHAFCWKIKQSRKCKNLFVAPGNAGTSVLATNLDISIKDFVKTTQNDVSKFIDKDVNQFKKKFNKEKGILF